MKVDQVSGVARMTLLCRFYSSVAMMMGDEFPIASYLAHLLRATNHATPACQMNYSLSRNSTLLRSEHLLDPPRMIILHVDHLPGVLLALEYFS